MTDDLLAAAAEALGAPPELVMRSAEARASAEGKSVEEILAAWAGGHHPTAPPETPEPELESVQTEEPEEVAAAAPPPSAAEAAPPPEPVAAEPEPPPAAPQPAEPVTTPSPPEPAEPVTAPSPPDRVSISEAAEFEVVTSVSTASLKERTQTPVPRWLGSVFVVIPLFAVFLLLTSTSPECGEAGALEVDPITGVVVNCDGSEFEGSGAGDGGIANFLAIGEEVFEQRGCEACHGARGEGTPAGPPLTGVTRTFSMCVDQVAWVTLGSAGWAADIGSTYGDTDKPVFGFGQMPSFSAFTEEQLKSVALFERVRFDGAPLEESLVDCGLVAQGGEEEPVTEEEESATGGETES